MLADYDTSDVARARDTGGLSAFMYFLTESLCMPSSRAIPRMDSPLRFALRTAFHLAALDTHSQYAPTCRIVHYRMLLAYCLGETTVFEFRIIDCTVPE